MDKQLLAERFRRAHTWAVSCAQKYVHQNLPPDARFLLYPSQSYDGNPLTGDEETFPQERLPDDAYLGPLTEEEVIDWLWREGKVPEWSDLFVVAQDSQFTYIKLLCCGRFTAKDEWLYHQREGYAPFHVLSPVLPPGWDSLEKSGKFDLYWGRKNPFQKKWWRWRGR